MKRNASHRECQSTLGSLKCQQNNGQNRPIKKTTKHPKKIVNHTVWVLENIPRALTHINDSHHRRDHQKSNQDQDYRIGRGRRNCRYSSHIDNFPHRGDLLAPEHTNRYEITDNDRNNENRADHDPGATQGMTMLVMIARPTLQSP